MKVTLCRLAILVLTAALLIPMNSIHAQEIPDEAYVCCVYGSPQMYTLSCEARAAVDWAGFFGYSIAEYNFMAALPSSDDPEEGFVGAWNGIWGNIPPYAYGVHPPPVAETLRSFNVPAEAYSNLTWDDLRREVAAGRPVIVWVIAQMWPGTPVEYITENGESVTVAYFEHTMILTGYNSASVQVVDPLTGQTKYFFLDAFLTSWAVLGSSAILAGELAPSPTPTQTATPTQTPLPTSTPTATPSPTPISRITVQPGDTLLGIAETYGLSWQALSSHNGLRYPYFIYPGDILLLP